jgi:preprotein translocase subunit YajC
LLSYVVLWVPIIAIFYFLMIAPQRKRQKQVREMLENLKNGDKVVTSGGLLGTIVRVNKEEDSIRLRIATSVEVDLQRSAVTGVVPEAAAGSKS